MIKNKHLSYVLVLLLLSLNLVSCSKTQELEIEEINKQRENNNNYILENTVYKPYKGQEFNLGKEGGTLHTALSRDPKTFNYLIAQKDSLSNYYVNLLTTAFVKYNPETKEWESNACDMEIETNEKEDKLTVHYTIKDDLYWTFLNSDEKVKVTSDDIVWWINNVDFNPAFHSSSYPSLFITMEDGSIEPIKVVKIDDSHFDFIFPRIVQDPYLESNSSIKPSFLYKKLLKDKPIEDLVYLFTVDTDPSLLPSIGRWYISSYTPGQNIVCKKNKNYLEKDKNGVSSPYFNEMVIHFVADKNTEFLMFKDGKLDTFIPTTQNISEVIKNKGDKYTVFTTKDSAGVSSFWTFNQNPLHKDKPFYNWFTKKEFRQAMSSLINKKRIINDVNRGLATSKDDFFCEINPYYNEKLKNKYTYNPKKAISLLKKIGIEKKKDGFMYDNKGNKIEFNLAIGANNNNLSDVSMILKDELEKVGITLNVTPIDFQNLVQKVTTTYDWESVIIAIGDSFPFPTKGSNIMQSKGNLHLWYPEQPKPATEWEERIDYLYNKGRYTLDKKESQKIWDEYQSIVLEQCPMIYLTLTTKFFAISNRFNLDNFYFDQIWGGRDEWIYLK